MSSLILLTTSASTEVNTSIGYIIGAVVALFIFGYLLYSLIKPEKF